MLIPRGGAGLHKLCREQSTIPVITGGIGVCHIYVDESVEIAEALKVIVNAKTQRPSTCNTVETLLVNKNIAHSAGHDMRSARHYTQMQLHWRSCRQALRRWLLLKPKSMTMSFCH